MSLWSVSDQLGSLLLDSFQHIFLIMGSPEPGTSLQMCLTSTEQEGRTVCVYSSSLNRLLATLVARMHRWLMLHQGSQVLQSHCSATRPQPVLLHEAADPPHSQDLPSPFVNLHEVPVSLFLQPVHDPSSTALPSSTQKTLNWPPVGLCTPDHSLESGSAANFLLINYLQSSYLPSSEKSKLRKTCYRPTKAKIWDICLWDTPCSLRTTESSNIHQVWFVLFIPMLAAPTNPILTCHMFRNGFYNDL